LVGAELSAAEEEGRWDEVVRRVEGD
jgi:hypothetical protein